MKSARRDAALTTTVLALAVWLGSGGGRHLDPALFGYLGATFVAVFAASARVSAFWRRPAAAYYGATLRRSLRSLRDLLRAFSAAGQDLGAQRFIAHRSRLRWSAHLALSLGTLVSFAITVPLVFGWLRFEAEGQESFRPMLIGVSLPAVPLDGILAWLVFHGLSLAGVAVLIGAAALLLMRLMTQGAPRALEARHVAPLLLLAIVALTGLALPASRGSPAAFALAAWLHEAAVVTMLVAFSCSKLSHVFVRPLQIGARLVRLPEAPRGTCVDCGEPSGPAAQIAAVATITAARGASFGAHGGRCARCRRRAVARAQAELVGAGFHHELLGARRPNGGGA